MRTRQIFLILLIVIPSSLSASLCFCNTNSFEPYNLQCNYLSNPLGIDSPHPLLSWELPQVTGQRGSSQSAYRLLVASTRTNIDLNHGDLHDSGRVNSDQSVNVPYAGKSLRSRQECFWKVMFWDQNGKASGWSKPGHWTMGLMRAGDWQAKWITTPDGTGPDKPSPWFRKAFSIKSRPVNALVYVSSVGYHELYINGRKAGNGILTPSVSHLGRRARYITYDVTEMLTEGQNCIGLWLGNGWASHLEFGPENKAGLIAQLEVTLQNGAVLTIVTDGSWATNASPITGIGKWMGEQYGGERFDARKDTPDWSRASLNETGWKASLVSNKRPLILSAEMIEPNQIVQTLKPIEIRRNRDGSLRIDMGKAFTGWFEILLKGPQGREISLEYSERENESISYGQRDVYVCSGKDATPFRNRFNYHAFRWVTIRGLDNDPDPGNISGYLIRTAFTRAATFLCSDDLINRIYEMNTWTFESLSLGGYVVDCPHRERLGYGGDAHASMETGMGQFRTGAFYTKWLQDWRDSQEPNGEMPHSAPQILGGGGPAWGGIIVVLPWEMYRRLGDRQILEISYPSMQKWLAFLESKTHAGILQPFNAFCTRGQSIWSFLGDWLPPGRGMSPGQRVDDFSTLFFNNCYFLLNLEIASKTAEVLGKNTDAQRYRTRAAQLASQLHRIFFRSVERTYANGEQTYLVFPLLVGVVPNELRPDILRKLEDRIEVTDKDHINTGMHGTWLLYRFLSSMGRDDLLMKIMRQNDYPGWGYMIKNGASTLWEEWNGDNSRLHSTLMGAGQWFTEGISGIRPDETVPGYKHFVLKPAVVRDLLFARGTFHSPYGEIISYWKRDGGRFRWTITVPPNTKATVHVPTQDPESVREKGIPARTAEGVKFVRTDGATAVYEVSSGKYEFESSLN